MVPSIGPITSVETRKGADFAGDAESCNESETSAGWGRKEGSMIQIIYRAAHRMSGYARTSLEERAATKMVPSGRGAKLPSP